MKLANVRWALVAGLLFSAGDFLWPYGTARIPGFPGSIAANVEESAQYLNILTGVFAASIALPFIFSSFYLASGRWSRDLEERRSAPSRTVRLRAGTAAILLCGGAYIGATRESWYFVWIGWLLWTFVAPSEARNA